MQQTHPDHPPQQQIQFTNQQQQPMMLCPVQFLYDPQILVPPGKPDEHPQPSQTFQNQTFLINVQNPPPWIQNRTNMVYMPQIQMNNIPYMQQNMIQNPMYYQYQPMIMQQDMRLTNLNQHLIQNQQTMMQNQNVVQNQQSIVQNPQSLVQNPQSLVQNPQSIVQNPQTIVQNQRIIHNSQNTSQNQQTIIQNPQNIAQTQQTIIQNPQSIASNQQTVILNQQSALQTPNIIDNPVRYQHIVQKQEMPVLTQMLQSQLIRKPINQNESTSQMQMIRPQYQTLNQQMITLSPINNHTNVHNNAHVKDQTSGMSNAAEKSEVPQHIRNQIPEGLSVKTVFRLPMTATVRPNEYVLQSIAPTDGVHPRFPKPVMKNSTTNTETRINYKRKIRELIEQNAKDETTQPPKKTCLTKQEVNIIRLNEFARSNALRNELSNSSQKEEKLLRNTVFVQARGRINETIHKELTSTSDVSTNTSNSSSALNIQFQNDIKNANVLIDCAISLSDSEPLQNEIKKAINSTSNKEINESLPGEINHVAPTNNLIVQDNQTHEKETEKEATPSDQNIVHNTNVEPTIEKETESEENLHSEVHTEISKDETVGSKNEPITEKDSPKAKEPKNITAVSSESGDRSQIPKKIPKLDILKKQDGTANVKEKKRKYNKKQSVTENINKNADEHKIVLTKNEVDSKPQKKRKSSNELENTTNAESEELVTTNVYMKETVKKYVLTHVLDGHIIQESNVPFVVQKPTLSPTKKAQNTLARNELYSLVNKEKTVRPDNNDSKEFSKVEEETGLSSNKKETAGPSSKNRQETRFSSNNREDTGSSSDKTEKAGSSSKHKEAGPSSKNREKAGTSLKNREEAGLSSNKREKAGLSLKNREEADPSLKNREETGPSSNKSEKTGPSLKNREEAGLSSKNKEEAGPSSNNKDDAGSSSNNKEGNGLSNKEISKTKKIKPNTTNTEEAKLPKVDKDGDDSVNEEDPFKEFSKSTVKTWSVTDLYQHLSHPSWQETAQMLRDEEIDGESLLLVNKDQLMHIGISEKNAQIIGSFLEKGQ